MPTANIQYPDSLEQVYSPDAFAIDAAQNGQMTSQVIHGVRILSAPNASGYFDFERASQLAAEAKSSTFLAPYRREAKLTDAERDSTTRPTRETGTRTFSPISSSPPSNLVSSPRKALAVMNRVCKD
jgi:hypothetical protein